MRRLYDTHVQSHLIYALPIWGSAKEEAYLKPLVLLQKRFVRLVQNVPVRAHTKPIMDKLGILTIPNLYVLRVCSEMHPHIHQPHEAVNRPTHIHHYTETANAHRHATRGAITGHKHLAKPSGYYAQKYVSIWNNLPTALRSIENHKEFKGLLKAHLLAIQSST